MSVASQGLNWSRLITRAGLTRQWTGPVDPLITSVVEDSRQAGSGSCFVATRGTQADGHSFVTEALRAGASAVVCERALPLPNTVATLRVNSARGVAGRLASVLYGLDGLFDDRQLKVVGITGTNGKSTFCYLLRAILQAAGHSTAMLGTVQYDLVRRVIDASMTTPAATTLMQYLAEAADAGATHVVMEVSSHALDQGRCDGIPFAVGVFSNLTGDHLDYHKDTAAYLRAKKRLFDGLAADAVAVVNAEDGASEAMVADCRARVIWYGLTGQVGASVHEATIAGTRFELTVQPEAAGWLGVRGTVQPVVTTLVGRHNVQNCLAAAGAALSLGIPLETVAAGLAAVRQVPGRLQGIAPVGSGHGEGGDLGFTVLVDYAHTDDALDNVLSALRGLSTTRRLIALFGCGGDRDRSKRPRMAAVAARWADRIVVTSDNPRTEDPQQIIDDIMAGFTADQRRQVHLQPDRAAAIAEAIAMADVGDVVLLAGKGHEHYQIIGPERRPFDDAAVAAEVLRGLVEKG